MIEHEQYYRKGGTYELPIEIYNDLIGQIEEAQKERDNYKQTNEKAIAYIEKNQERKTYYGGICDGEDYYILYNSDEVLNILNGSDEE